MSGRYFIALGTASQVPTRKRNHNGYFLKWDREGLLFDPGEGTQRQMIHAGVAASEITKIFITHFHGDHCLGLAGIIQRLSLDGVTRPIQVFYPASGEHYLNNLRNASAFYDRTDLYLTPLKEPGPVFSDSDLEITAMPLSHTIDSWGFRIVEPDRLSIIPDQIKALGIEGSLIGKLKKEGTIEWQGKQITVAEVSRKKPGQVFSFVMDTRVCDNAVRLAEGADMLVCEATFLEPEAHLAEAHGHMTAAGAAKVAAQAHAKTLILTHFSARYENLEGHQKEAEAIHTPVHVMEDGTKITFPRP